MSQLDEAFTVPGLSLDDELGIFYGSGDPSISGFEAPLGSLYLRVGTGSLYQKSGVLDTGWSLKQDALIGDYALLNVKNDGTLWSNNISTRGFDRLNIDTMGDVSAVAGTQTFSHAVKSGQSEFHFWAGGQIFSKTTTQSVTFADTTGTYYFYYDINGVLQSIANSAMTEAIFLVSAICGLLYYNKEEGIVWLADDEMHGILMMPSDHFLTHLTLKFRKSYGGDLVGLVDGSSTFTSISAGIYHDEDITKISTESTALKFMYRDGANGGWKLHSNVADNAIALMNGVNAVWNENVGGVWQLTDCDNSTDYVIGYTIETNLAGDAGRAKVIGQHAYSSRALARQALFDNVDTLYLEGLSSSEAQFQYAYIYKKDGTLEDDGNGELYIDLSTYSPVSSSTGIVAHSSTTGRDAVDSHPQSAITDLVADLATKEDGLGNPTVDNYVLSSTIAGIRTWVASDGGGGGSVDDATSMMFAWMCK